MKFDKFEDNKVETLLDEEESLEFSIDKEDDWLIFKSFINYANPIDSIVREIVSNAFDAHVDAGYKGDVEIEITERSDLTGTSDMFIVRDFGTGISPKIMKEIYSKFGKSTKRETNDSIGAFGFGAKSPLGYSNMFELITYVDGTRYHYAIHKGEKRPSITKLAEEPTDRQNGTTVRVNIKEGDIYSFRSSIQKSLRYFEGISYTNCNVSNDYTIIKGKGYIIRFDKPVDGVAHPTEINRKIDLCLGKVSYPLNVSALPEIDHSLICSIGLFFDIGEIPVVWNRESVEYTSKTVKAIQDRFFQVKDYFQAKINEQWNAISSLKDLYEKKQTSNNEIVIHKTDDTEYKIKINRFVKTKVTHPKYTPLDVESKKAYIDIVLRTFYTISSGERYLSTSSWQMGAVYNYTKDCKWIIADTNAQVSSLMSAYLKKEYPDGCIIVKRRDYSWKGNRKYLLELAASYDFYYYPFKTPKEKRQKMIAKAKELYRDLYDQCTIGMTKLDSITISDEFKEEWDKRHEEKLQRQKEKFNFMHAHANTFFTRDKTQGSKLKERFGTRMVIYGFHDDRKLLRDLISILGREYRRRNLKIEVIQISKKNERVIKEELPDTAVYCKKAGNKRPFSRIGDKYNINQYFEEIKHKFVQLPGYSKLMEKLSGFDQTVPSYVTPIEPDQEEIDGLYAEIGMFLKYPMKNYVQWVSDVPKEYLEEYKQSCKYHNFNPILITKLYLKNYEEKSNSV